MEQELFNLEELTDYQIRTLHILYHAEKLLLQYGYSKVTIDEIAHESNLGKGTIYLHWKSKEDLFYSLLSKSAAEVVCELINAIESNRDMVTLDNLIVKLYSICLEKKIILALFTRDSKILGKLINKGDSKISQRVKEDSLRDSIEMYRRYNLMRTDVPVDIQLHSINMLLIGIFNYTSYLTEGISVEQQLLMLKTIIKNTFLPPGNYEISKEVYDHIHNELNRFFDFYKTRILNTTLK